LGKKAIDLSNLIYHRLIKFKYRTMLRKGMAPMIGQAGSGIKAKCKRCGKEAPTTEFTLDPVYRMMVCAACVKERRDKDRVSREIATQKAEDAKHPKEQKAPGWDEEDAFLERKFKEKMTSSVKVEAVDDDKVKYTCPKCKYNFIYDIGRKHPGACPYCGAEISQMRF
jgi:hypothetical protein